MTGGVVAWLAGFDPASFGTATTAGAFVGAVVGFVRKDREESRQRQEARRQTEALQKEIQATSESERQLAIDSSPFLQKAIPEMDKAIAEEVARNPRLRRKSR